MALSSYDVAFLNDEQEKQIAGFQSAWEKASKAGDKVGMASAHAAAEKVRSSQGYSGGVAGNQYIPQAVSNIVAAVTGNSGGSQVTPGGAALPAAKVPDTNGNSSGTTVVYMPAPSNGANVGGGGGSTYVPSDPGTSVPLPYGVYGGDFQSATGVSDANPNLDIPQGLKSLILVLGGVVAIGFIFGGRRR